MELREAENADAGRVRELARATMTAAYALSPQQLDAIVEERFAEDSLREAFEDEDTLFLVAENGAAEGSEGDTVVGFVEGRVTEGDGELHWLFVDPEHRGREIGTELFEGASETLREDGAADVSATVLEANTEGGTFFERLGLERTDEREREIGEASFVEYVYTEAEAEGNEAAGESEEAQADTDDADGSEETDVLDADLPETETKEEGTVATTAERTQVYLDREDVESGVEAPFVVAYADAGHTDRYGYYCANCGSLDTAVDESERIECADCANTHAERSAEAYDDSYL